MGSGCVIFSTEPLKYVPVLATATLNICLKNFAQNKKIFKKYSCFFFVMSMSLILGMPDKILADFLHWWKVPVHRSRY